MARTVSFEGVFQESSMTAPCPTFGFLVAMNLKPGLPASDRSALHGAWLSFLASRGLYARGSGGDHLEYEVASEASQATDSDCVAARTWLAGRAELASWHVGTIVDLLERRKGTGQLLGDFQMP